mgnify:CR=1 FL=1
MPPDIMHFQWPMGRIYRTRLACFSLRKDNVFPFCERNNPPEIHFENGSIGSGSRDRRKKPAASPRIRPTSRQTRCIRHCPPEQPPFQPLSCLCQRKTDTISRYSEKTMYLHRMKERDKQPARYLCHIEKNTVCCCSCWRALQGYGCWLRYPPTGCYPVRCTGLPAGVARFAAVSEWRYACCKAK